MTDHRDRVSRAEAIRSGALVRKHLGQGAILRRSGGRWCVIFRGRLYVAEGLDEAVRLALEGRGTP